MTEIHHPDLMTKPTSTSKIHNEDNLDMRHWVSMPCVCLSLDQVLEPLSNLKDGWGKKIILLTCLFHPSARSHASDLGCPTVLLSHLPRNLFSTVRTVEDMPSCLYNTSSVTIFPKCSLSWTRE